MVPSSIGGKYSSISFCCCLLWVLSIIYFFIYSFVSDHWQYLACLWNHYALRQWDRPARTTIQVLASMAGTCCHPLDGRRIVSSHVAAKPGCTLIMKHFTGRLLLGILLAGWRKLTSVTSCIRPIGFPRRWTFLIKPSASTLLSAHYSLGNALVQSRTSQAIAEYKTALRIDPDYAEAHNNLGSTLLLTGRTAEAIHEYEQALRIDPAYAKAHNNLGSALVQTGRASEAIDHFKRALRMNPNSASAHSNLGAALAQIGRESRRQ